MDTSYTGQPAKGLEFYNLLFDSPDFNIELGKVTLAAGRIEAELILFFKRNGVTERLDQLTLGTLIKVGKRHNLFDKNLVIVLEELCRQRNYLTHNIYALFIDLVDESILEKHNLIDTDVITYCERARQLQENLVNMADIIRNK